MSDNSRFAPSAEIVQRAHIDDAGYQAMYDASVKTLRGFGANKGKLLIG